MASLNREQLVALFYRQMKIYAICHKSKRLDLREAAEHARITADFIEQVTGQLHNPPASDWK